jgi:hypothetical protein
VIEKLRGLRLSRAAKLVEAAVEETLTYYAFPEEHWRRIRTNNPLERILREIRRRTRVVGAFPDGLSCMRREDLARERVFEAKSPRSGVGIPDLMHNFLPNASECLDYARDRRSYERNEAPKYSHKNSKRNDNWVERNRDFFFSIHIAPSDLFDSFYCFEKACE